MGENPSVLAPGEVNLRSAWFLIAAGLGLGAILGLWSFDGPFPAPAGMEDFGDLPRRLVRLAHIALLALPILSLHYIPALRASALDSRTKERAARLLHIGTVGLPLTLIAAALFPPLKYLLPAPAPGTWPAWTRRIGSADAPRASPASSRPFSHAA